MTPATSRPYAGRTADERTRDRRERILASALELMGTVGVSGLTVRAVIDRTGMAPRYFYESFTSLDELQVTVFTGIGAEIEKSVLEALENAGPSGRARIRAAVDAVATLLLEDPRKGRIVLVEALGSPILGARRLAEAKRFAHLLATYSGGVWLGAPAENHAVQLTTQFAVGGFAESLGLVLSGQLVVDHDTLVDDLTELFVGLGPSFRKLADRGVTDRP